MQPEATEMKHLALHRSRAFQILLLNLGWHLLGLQLHWQKEESTLELPHCKDFTLSVQGSVFDTQSPDRTSLGLLHLFSHSMNDMQ